MSNLSYAHRATGDLPGAIEHAQSGVAIWRTLSDRSVAQFQPELGAGLKALGELQVEAKDDGAARTHAETLAIYRSLSATEPLAFGPELAKILMKGSSSAADKYEHLVAVNQAIDLLRHCAQESVPAEHSLPEVLERKAALLQEFGIDVRAITALREAVRIDERFLQSDPNGHVHSLVTNLIRLARLYRRGGAVKQATETIARAYRLSVEYPGRLSHAQIEEVTTFSCPELTVAEGLKKRALAAWMSMWLDVRLRSVLGARRIQNAFT